MRRPNPTRSGRFPFILLMCVVIGCAGATAWARPTHAAAAVTTTQKDTSSPDRLPEEGALTPSQWAALQTALAQDGLVNEKIHGAFWGPQTEKTRDGEQTLSVFAVHLKEAVTAGLRFQREIWRSAALSAEAGEIGKTPEFAAARERATSLYQDQEDPSPPNAALSKTMLEALANAERIIAAAADGAALDLGTGPIPMDRDRIRGILSGVEATLYRVDLLLTPEWAPLPTDHTYQDAELVLRWPAPFTVDIQRRAGRSGRSLKTVTLSHRSDIQEFAFVTVIEFSGPWRDPQQGMLTLAEKALRASGLDKTEITPAPWQERLGALGTGARLADDDPGDGAGAVYAAVRVIERPEKRAAVTLTALSGTSQEAALSRLTALEKALTLSP